MCVGKGKHLLVVMLLVCGVAFPVGGGGGRHRNVSEYSLTV